MKLHQGRLLATYNQLFWLYLQTPSSPVPFLCMIFESLQYILASFNRNATLVAMWAQTCLNRLGWERRVMLRRRYIQHSRCSIRVLGMIPQLGAWESATNKRETIIVLSGLVLPDLPPPHLGQSTWNIPRYIALELQAQIFKKPALDSAKGKRPCVQQIRVLHPQILPTSLGISTYNLLTTDPASKRQG